MGTTNHAPAPTSEPKRAPQPPSGGQAGPGTVADFVGSFSAAAAAAVDAAAADAAAAAVREKFPTNFSEGYVICSRP